MARAALFTVTSRECPLRREDLPREGASRKGCPPSVSRGDEEARDALHSVLGHRHRQQSGSSDSPREEKRGDRRMHLQTEAALKAPGIKMDGEMIPINAFWVQREKNQERPAGSCTRLWSSLQHVTSIPGVPSLFCFLFFFAFSRAAITAYGGS